MGVAFGSFFSNFFLPVPMADCGDPQIAEGYQAVRSDSDDTDWFVCGYSGPTKIVFQAKGSDGFDGFAAALKDDQCQYGFVRFTTGDEESKRAKFAFISWGGPSAKALARAKMSVHKASVKEVVRDFAIEYHAAERADLDADKIRQTIIKAGGANYMGQNRKSLWSDMCLVLPS